MSKLWAAGKADGGFIARSFATLRMRSLKERSSRLKSLFVVRDSLHSLPPNRGAQSTNCIHSPYSYANTSRMVRWVALRAGMTLASTDRITTATSQMTKPMGV